MVGRVVRTELGQMFKTKQIRNAMACFSLINKEPRFHGAG